MLVKRYETHRKPSHPVSYPNRPVPWSRVFEPHPLLIVLSFPQNSSKTVRHSYQFETVPEPCMRAAKQLAVLHSILVPTRVLLR